MKDNNLPKRILQKVKNIIKGKEKGAVSNPYLIF
jgi:hypothetical protein